MFTPQISKPSTFTGSTEKCKMGSFNICGDIIPSSSISRDHVGECTNQKKLNTQAKKTKSKTQPPLPSLPSSVDPKSSLHDLNKKGH
jgi:hypothetical protein